MSRLLVIFLLFACNSQPLTDEEVVETFAKNIDLYSIDRNVGSWKYSVIWRPSGYLESKAILKGENLSESNYENSTYFILEISRSDGTGDVAATISENYQEYSDIIKYLSFHYDKEVTLQHGGETYSPGFFHFERAFEVGKGDKFHFAFPLAQADIATDLVFQMDMPLLHSGTLNFRFDNKADLKKYS